MRWVLSSKGVRAAVAAVLVVCAGLTVSACSATQDDADVDVVAGKRLFAERCGSCHILSRAETKGVAGPNLDEAFQQSLKDGLGRSGIRGAVRAQINAPSIGSGMPADLVEGDQADQVAAYVAQVGRQDGRGQRPAGHGHPEGGRWRAGRRQGRHARHRRPIPAGSSPT